ncbi:hypothetical protein DWB84_13780 [Saccharophagus sp. K07]|nr:hypothetical protein [Saccharophagus sp. K07]
MPKPELLDDELEEELLDDDELLELLDELELDELLLDELELAVPPHAVSIAANSTPDTNLILCCAFISFPLIIARKNKNASPHFCMKNCACGLPVRLSMSAVD